jgi:hypothetical protein
MTVIIYEASRRHNPQPVIIPYLILPSKKEGAGIAIRYGKQSSSDGEIFLTCPHRAQRPSSRL